MNPVRGDLWWCDFGDPVGHEQGFRRPGLVVSTEVMQSPRSRLALMVPVTTRDRGIPLHVRLETGRGLQRVSFAKCEDLRSVSVDRLTDRIGDVAVSELRRVDVVLAMLLGLDPRAELL